MMRKTNKQGYVNEKVCTLGQVVFVVSPTTYSKRATDKRGSGQTGRSHALTISGVEGGEG